MIGYLRGTALSDSLLDVNGVGYRLHTPEPLTPGAFVELQVTTIVRDDAITLYGFTSTTDQAVFAALTRVSGVGPASALALLATLGASGIATAVAAKDETALASVRGIGKKAAAAIAATCTLPDGIAVSADPRAAEIATALIGLGFEKAAAANAARVAVAAYPDADDTAVLQAALEHAGGHRG